MTPLDHFDDNSYFEYINNPSTTLQSLEDYDNYSVSEVIHLYHVYDIRKNFVQMNHLIVHLNKRQLQLLLKTAEKFELYEFCAVILNKINSCEKDSY